MRPFSVLDCEFLLYGNEDLRNFLLQINVSFDFFIKVFFDFLLFASCGPEDVPFLLAHSDESNYNV